MFPAITTFSVKGLSVDTVTTAGPAAEARRAAVTETMLSPKCRLRMPLGSVRNMCQVSES